MAFDDDTREFSISFIDEDAARPLSFAPPVPDKLIPLELTFSSPAITKKTAPKRRKKATPIVDTAVRRCTRSTLKRDGFKAGNLTELPLAPKRKKPKAKPMMKEAEEEKAQGPAQQEEQVVPPTPIKVIQAIGADLQIDPALLTKEKLMADPAAASQEEHDD